MNFNGVRVAVAGMAKSGLSVARAVRQLGGVATVFDQKQADSPAIYGAMDELHAMDVQAVPGWHGRLDPAEFELLVVSPGFPREHPALSDMSQREVIGEIEFAFRIARDPIVAITGTNGKSTTTALAWSLLKGAGKEAVLCGNIAGSGYPEVTITDAALLGGDVLVAEVSSFQLETIKSFRPFVAAITSIAPDHLDRHPSFEDYKRCKLRLFENMGAGDTIVINVDDRSVDREELPEGPRRVKFSPRGLGATNGYSARAADQLFLCGLQIKVESLPLLGEHNVANAMMAWEIACSVLGEPSEDEAAGMLSALLQFKGLANRMEVVGERGCLGREQLDVHEPCSSGREQLRIEEEAADDPWGQPKAARFCACRRVFAGNGALGLFVRSRYSRPEQSVTRVMAVLSINGRRFCRGG